VIANLRPTSINPSNANIMFMGFIQPWKSLQCTLKEQSESPEDMFYNIIPDEETGV
jgi:hypothetical protein